MRILCDPRFFMPASPPPHLEHSGSLVSTCQSCETSSGKHWQGGIGPISAGLWVVQHRRPQYPISTKYYFRMCENFINFSSIGHRPISWSSITVNQNRQSQHQNISCVLAYSDREHNQIQWRSQRGGGMVGRTLPPCPPPNVITLCTEVYGEPPFWVPGSPPPLSPPCFPLILKSLATTRIKSLRVRTVAKRHMRSSMFTASFILVSCVKLP